MYSVSQNKTTLSLGAVLLSGLVAATSAAAGETALTQNEIAAQSTIVETASSRAMPTDESVATLAHNEDAAQRAVVDASGVASGAARVAMGEALLSHNEQAAQQAIAAASVDESAKAARISATFAPRVNPAAAR